MSTVPEAYLALAVMTLVGIGFPVGSFVASRFLRPTPSAHDNNKLRSILLPGYETDQSLYVRERARMNAVQILWVMLTSISISSTIGMQLSSWYSI